MKKFILIAAVAFTFAACNSGAKTEAPATTTTTVDSVKVDSSKTTTGTTTGTTTTVVEPVKAAK